MYRCTSCGKFPFCDIAPQNDCEEWTKRSYETKLVKVEGENYKFERIDSYMEDIKEKTANELFSELGYKIEYENPYNICYRNKRGSHIYFAINDKSLDLAGEENGHKIITYKQLQAINKKCKELRLVRR